MTDHADEATMYHSLENVLRFVKKHGHFYDINVLAGVELTHVAPAPDRRDGRLPPATSGAQVVVMHGETPVEPVAPGTNLAAIEAGVDILAHPGLITEEEVKLAAEKGVALEITTRGGHSYTKRPCGGPGPEIRSKAGGQQRRPRAARPGRPGTCAGPSPWARG